jgi:hypothetical protein
MLIKQIFMQQRNRSSDSGQEESIRNRNEELQEDKISNDIQDETTREPVLDEADMEENDLSEEELDDIEWDEPAGRDENEASE